MSCRRAAAWRLLAQQLLWHLCASWHGGTLLPTQHTPCAAAPDARVGQALAHLVDPAWPARPSTPCRARWQGSYSPWTLVATTTCNFYYTLANVAPCFALNVSGAVSLPPSPVLGARRLGAQMLSEQMLSGRSRGAVAHSPLAWPDLPPHTGRKDFCGTPVVPCNWLSYGCHITQALCA